MRVWGNCSPGIASRPLLLGRRSCCLLLFIAATVASRPAAIGADAGESLDFANAILFTPARTNTENRVFRFAPLLVLETSATNLAGLSLSDRFGAVEEVGGRLEVNLKLPTLYAHNDVLAIHGQPYERYSYVWWRRPTGSNGPIFAQGLRITATPGGQPMAYEILDAPSKSPRLVVSQSLETAARQEYRRPLPGRRFVVEQSGSDTPGADVSRVIDDGPLELGPVVYLRSGTGGVGTVICRCMPAQTRAIAVTGYYDLVEWNDVAAGFLEKARAQSGIKPLWWPAASDNDPGLETLLRLPRHFPGTPTTP